MLLRKMLTIRDCDLSPFFGVRHQFLVTACEDGLTNRNGKIPNIEDVLGTVQ